MNAAASLASGETVRLFCALTLPAGVQGALGDWQRDSLRVDAHRDAAQDRVVRHQAGDSRGARLVERAHLHVTLAFLGSRPRAEIQAIADALAESVRSVGGPIVFEPVRYRETRSVGMLVLADEADRATTLAFDLHQRLEAFGVYEREQRPWLPHLTVMRFRTPPRLRPALPKIEPFSPSEAAVYHSVLRPGGAQYEVLESVPLGRQVGG